MKIDMVTFDEMSQMGIVLLVTDSDKRALPIWVGLFEAQAILLKIQGSVFPRPLTHDLLKNCIENLGGKVESVVVTELTKNTFFAHMNIQKDGKPVCIDCRPSDAIALAVRTNVPIYVEDKVFEESSVDKDEFIKEQKEKLYTTYLESLDDEDLDRLKH
jgi:hypothetical protein